MRGPRPRLNRARPGMELAIRRDKHVHLKPPQRAVPIGVRMKTFSIVLSTVLALGATGAFADTSKEIKLDGQTNTHEFDLAGSVSKTLYRYEDYQTTCTRSVP